MNTVTFALLALLSAAGSAGLSVLLKDQPQRLTALTACPANQGGCYIPPPSIGRLMP
ncbi:hypothetical protein D9M68_326350 [compost metagenome]